MPQSPLAGSLPSRSYVLRLGHDQGGDRYSHYHPSPGHHLRSEWRRYGQRHVSRWHRHRQRDAQRRWWCADQPGSVWRFDYLHPDYTRRRQPHTGGQFRRAEWLCGKQRQRNACRQSGGSCRHRQQRDDCPTERQFPRSRPATGFVGTDNAATASRLRGLLDHSPSRQSGGNLPYQCSGAVEPNYTIAYVAARDHHRRSADHHRQQCDPRIRSSESNVHRHVYNLRERRYACFADGCTELHDYRNCHEPGGTLSDHVLGTDFDQLHHHVRAGNVDRHGGRASPHTEPDRVGLHLTPGVTTIAQTITVTNTGGAALRITGITLAGANPLRFGMTQNCPIDGPA